MHYFILFSGTNGSFLKPEQIEFTEVNVDEGDSFELKCTSLQTINSCTIEISGLPEIKFVGGDGNAQYEHFGSLEDGKCGVRVFKAEKKHQGAAKCIVTYPNNNKAQMATTNVTVSFGIPPSSMELRASHRYFEFKEGEAMEFDCKALHGTSPAIISIFLGI